MEDTRIAWAHHTFNPWIGCSRVSAECLNCYAEDEANRRWPDVQWRQNGGRHFTAESYWAQPVKWNHTAMLTGQRVKVFCASLADVFEDREDLDSTRNRLFTLIEDTKWIDWLLLTKRPGNVSGLAPAVWMKNGFPPNVILGVSAGTQRSADLFIPQLLTLPVSTRMVSAEPLLEPVSFDWYLGDAGLKEYGASVDWIIAGGESGPGFRDMDVDWARDIRDQCIASGTLFDFKQYAGLHPKKLGSELDGVIWNQHPVTPAAGNVQYLMSGGRDAVQLKASRVGKSVKLLGSSDELTESGGCGGCPLTV